MENTIVKGICQIGIFMICAQTFVHFCPKGSYEKYLKMLVSIMVLIQIISPIGKILNGEQWRSVDIQKSDWLEEALMQSMDEVLQEKMLTVDDGENIEEMEKVEENVESQKEVTTEQTSSIYIEPVAPIHVGQ